MASPLILIDSASGSDATCSGAGPTTALSGTNNASTNGTGLVVTLPAGTVLTGVATDGSHCLFIADSTAGARNFGKITATSGSGGATPTVTVANAFAGSLTGKSWAIGGKRASLGSTTSVRLLNNNGSAGDAGPGWTIEFADGHAEDVPAYTANVRNSGDATTGPITIRGASGASARPLLKCTTNGDQFMVVSGSYVVLQGFDIRYDYGTSSSYSAIRIGGNPVTVRDVRIYSADPTKTWTYGIRCEDSGATLLDCWVSNCSTACISLEQAGGRALYCRCGPTAGTGIGISINDQGGTAIGNVVGGSIGGAGISVDRSAASVFRPTILAHNTIYGTTGDGINVVDGAGPITLLNNLTVGCGGYGIDFNSATLAGLTAQGVQVLGHGFASCTSGNVNSGLSSLIVGGQASATLGNAGFGTGTDFTPGSASNLQAAYPTTRLGVS